MLGRQQIAGVPTAVSEVFKNAYDAYATHVRGDFFPERRVLVIRDNGIGMTTADFETRWLTIGTDSKAQGTTLPPIERPPGVAERRQMGEKGIGRLAIATIAPQLLVVTRANAALDGPDDHVTLALIQWSLFEAPGLTLEDVSVPIRRMRTLDELDPELINEMRAEFLDSLKRLEGRLPASHIQRIRSELTTLETDVGAYLALAGPRLDVRAGSAFILSGVYQDLDAAMTVSNSKKSDYSVSEFQRFLLGFTNTITPKPSIAEFQTQFIVHGPAGPTDVIDPSSYFWEASDFRKTDHTIEGHFDEYGTFHGKIRIYGNEPIEIVEPWKPGGGDRTACGAFDIKFGYVQGQASDSLLSPEEFTEMAGRLEKIGGLYVYRDGIRVLPYGNSDYDYLGIEQRRSLNAATYFFSYRRMFGAIEIDSARNPHLQEKAGREGFRENRAYREFRDILTEFLKALASGYFSAKSGSSDEWKNERDRLKRRADQAKSRNRAEKRLRDQFSRELFSAINFIESGDLAGEIARVVRDVSREVERALRDDIEPEVEALEARSMGDIAALAMRFNVPRPTDLPLSKEQEREWRSLERLTDYAELQLSNAASEIDRLLSSASTSAEDKQRWRWREQRLRKLAETERERVGALTNDVKAQAAKLRSELETEASTRSHEFASSVDSIIAAAGQVRASDERELARAIRAAADAHAAVLTGLLRFARSVDDLNELSVQNVALKEEVLDLHAQLDENLELLQLGQAVQIVSHEFEASIGAVRNGLKALAPWARSTPRLQPIVRDLRASFSHLDGYLRLFTPLQRRLYRESITIYGGEIDAFVRGVFDDRLSRHEIALRATDSFLTWSFSGYPSTFYPTFVNLVDNAIHWVTDGANTGEREVTMDFDGVSAFIRDTGPGVRERDREAIFERGFSRRRGGRGLGLSLAKELLARDGWDLALTSNGPGAEFRLSPPEESSSDDD